MPDAPPGRSWIAAGKHEASSSINDVQHCPSPIATSVPPYAVALAGRAVSAAKVVVYAGAGISMSQPTNLPKGADLAAAIHTRLKTAFAALATVDPHNLLAVADAVAALPGGEEALRLTAASSANFRTATPGYAHRVLAHLMLEGAIDILTTNWDNCIERGAGDEWLPTVTNSTSLAHVTPPWVLKIHGCASQPDSLLVSSTHLSSPPTWVQEQTRARLGSAVVLFIGIGDVAGYVQRRIEEALREVGRPVENIRVVAPEIVTKWDESQWKTLVPDLPEDHKIPATADLFMEQLAAAYVVGRIGEHLVNLSADVSLAADLDAAKTGLFKSDSLRVLQWARAVDINPRVGEPVLKSSELGKVLIALGHLAGTTARLNHNHIFDTDQGPVELLIATETVAPRRLVETAENRLQDHANRGEAQPLFIVAGGVGWIPKPQSLPRNILDEADETDVIDGPLALVLQIRHADEVIAS